MNIAFVGGGNMAHAMLSGLRDSGVPAPALQVLEPDAGKGAALTHAFGSAAHTAAGEWLRAADVIVLAVKPQQMREAVDALHGWMSAPLVLSIAAGVRGRTLARWLGHERIVRAMPNTPALIRAGITGAAALAGVSAAQREAADRILRSIGAVLWLEDESMLDAVTAVSGSGPAYVFTFIEALQSAGESLGLSTESARQLALHTFAGAARLACESSEPVATLRERVTSKGGTTAAALARLEAAGVRQQIIEAVRAARDRAVELGAALDDDRAAAPPR